MKVTIEQNELDSHFIFDIFVGITFTVFSTSCFILSTFWDFFARSFVLQHSEGIGIGQVSMVLSAGALTFIGVTYIQNVLLYMKYYGR